MPKPKLKVLERDIQQACEDLLVLDGFQILRLEQNFSEKKRKVIGDAGAPDALCVRYDPELTGCAEVLFVEFKRPGGKPSKAQLAWHREARLRGALTWIAGDDFEPTIEGFYQHYVKSGLCRRPMKVQGAE